MNSTVLYYSDVIKSRHETCRLGSLEKDFLLPIWLGGQKMFGRQFDTVSFHVIFVEFH